MAHIAVTVMDLENHEFIGHWKVNWVHEAEAIVRKHFPDAVFTDEGGLVRADVNGRCVATFRAFERRDDSVVGSPILDPTDWRNWPEPTQ